MRMAALGRAVRVRSDVPVRAVAPLHVPRAWVLAFGLVVGLIYFGSIGYYPLAEPDEPRYAEIPPLHLTSEDSVLRSPRFYLAVLGVGALWGGSFALDQTLRSHLHNMSPSDADLLQNISYGSISTSAALLYAYGFYTADASTRQNTLTAGEGAGVASLVNVGIKAAFGRLRPNQDDHSHTAFFRGGASFFSGDVTPMFGLAAGISENFDNAWYIAAPAYSLALLDGFGRMGHDAHWFSDVVGAGMLGYGTTELFLRLACLVQFDV